MASHLLDPSLLIFQTFTEFLHLLCCMREEAEHHTNERDLLLVISSNVCMYVRSADILSTSYYKYTYNA